MSEGEENPMRAFLSEEEIKRCAPPSFQEPGKKGGGRTPVIVSLREEKGWSQEDFAARLGVRKARLVSLERKAWKKISLEELELLARGLGMSAEELFFKFPFEASGDQADARASEKDPFFITDFLEGIRLAGYVRKPHACFIGTMILPPQKTLPRQKAPQAEFVFYCVLKGELLLTLPWKEYVLKPGECFSLDGFTPYELYNSHPVRELALILVTFPSSFSLPGYNGPERLQISRATQSSFQGLTPEGWVC